MGDSDRRWRSPSLALTSTGQVLAWGFNASSELGNGTTSRSDVSVTVRLPLGGPARSSCPGLVDGLTVAHDACTWEW